MSEKKLKIIVLTHGGANRLLELLSAIPTVEIAGVFVETKTEPQRTFKEKMQRSIRYDGYWATAKKFSTVVFGGETSSAEDLKTIRDKQNDLEKYAADLKIPLHKVANFHHETTLDLIKKTNADLGILYGTNIIKESVFSLPRLGSINLHQGLAPIYRGGPTVFWELFNGENEVGITIHFVAAKVDTGDIILQKTIPLEYDYAHYDLDWERFLKDFRFSLKEPSVLMIAEVVALIADGAEQRTKQDTSLGKRYRLPTKTEKNALLRVLKQRRSSEKDRKKT
jgi:folate-dependent phosphoribosylglycinamide formyltransferase PurN